MTYRPLACLLVLALAGCARLALPPDNNAQPGPDAKPAAAAPAVAGGAPPVPVAPLAVDPKAGTVGALRLGMTADEAVAAFGKPETRYHDFLAWNGGKVTAVLVAGKVHTLRVSDRTASMSGFHVGQPLEAAQKAFPGGKYETGEVPAYELPVKPGHAWMEVIPMANKEVLAVAMSLSDRPTEDEEHEGH